MRPADINNERGQTSAEYVAITAVAIVIAIGIGWFVLGVNLGSALSGIGDGLANAIDGFFA